MHLTENEIAYAHDELGKLLTLLKKKELDVKYRENEVKIKTQQLRGMQEQFEEYLFSKVDEYAKKV